MENSQTVKIGNITMGGGLPIVIQSMTNTDTAEVEATVSQILELHQAGSQMVRITVNDREAAAAVPSIVEKVRKKSSIPIIGDFHFNGNMLLREFPQMALSLDKYRINPGNARDKNFEEIIQIAIKNQKPIRIGVNGGSLDQQILGNLMNQNSRKKNPQTAEEVFIEAMVESVLAASEGAQKIGQPKNKIVLSAKMSELTSVVSVYEKLSKKTDLPLHLGLTEAGSGETAIIQSAMALGILLQQGIGSTIRVSLTPEIGAGRIKEVQICQQILQGLGIKNFRPKVISCPGCGRTTSTYFQRLAREINQEIDKKLEIWKQKYPAVENLKIAVMGCIVNGPGESQHADIAISLPGKMEKPIAPVYIRGKIYKSLKGDKITQEFLEILQSFIKGEI